MIRDWDDGPARTAGAAEYQAALGAAANRDHAASLEHLERSILAHPAFAESAQQDPAFDSMRDGVRDVVGRLSLLARIHAESEIGEAASALDADHLVHARAAMQQAQAYLDLAQAQFQSATYAGYIVAAQAAAQAQEVAGRSKIAPLAPLTPVKRESLAGPMTRAAWQGVRRLWQELPLLAVMLAWLLAGIVAGLASLPFSEGSVAEMRQTLFPIWGLGLLGMVVAGFLRSIRNLLRRRGL